MDGERPARLIAFYLPQFHPIPENDAWWGPGFTEWTNVARARALFPGHQQPQVPGELGYYDLREPEVRERQAALARNHGLEGFCYWHYWFEGRLLLQRPAEDVLASGRPDFPFCLAWANEPWSRRWTGEPTDILQDQTYGGAEDARRHFEYLLPFFKDRRAVRIGGRTVFLIYKANLIPDVRSLLAAWRAAARDAGLPGLYLISIETTGTYDRDPRPWGFDAALEFQPHWRKCAEISSPRPRLWRQWASGVLHRLDPAAAARLAARTRPGLRVWDYRRLWPRLLETWNREYPIFPGIFPRWDNTPRAGRAGLVIDQATPAEYGRWLEGLVAGISARPREQRLVFINAWNEWAEGNFLEPDGRQGRAFLEATDRANPAARERREDTHGPER